MDLDKRQDIIEKLQEINKNMTEDKIENATKEELIEYLKLVDQFKALLLTTFEE